jgi:anti-sigma factor RsiW
VPPLTCQDFVEFLDDYLGGGLDPARRDVFNEHLSLCPPCVAYMKSYREAARLGKAALASTGEGVPSEVPEGLVRAILAARPRSS